MVPESAGAERLSDPLDREAIPSFIMNQISLLVHLA
jgi:hypothetical protein